MRTRHVWLLFGLLATAATLNAAGAGTTMR